ncbi:CvpA family protein [Paenibacillus cymbidii]|uniref:CvpA family protein n=1 Tax=Paenibacillus cymbidii TaxID=1639034 RepID=UPI0010815C46|nr:CvpA family protein [Paenibacillus cymbidii]
MTGSWNGLDIAVGVILLIAVAIGYRRGFISQLISLLGLVIAYIAAYKLHPYVSPWIKTIIPLQTFTAYEHYEPLITKLRLDVYVINALAFALIFFAVKIGLSVVGRVLNMIAKVPGLNMTNRLAGAGLALLEAAVIVAIGLYVMKIMPSDGIQTLLAGSGTMPFVQEHVPVWLDKLTLLWNGGDINADPA